MNSFRFFYDAEELSALPVTANGIMLKQHFA
jgi:hypothetical protein